MLEVVHPNGILFEFKELKIWTRNFSEENYIGPFQYGKLYRGKLGDRNIIVKIWEVPEIYHYEPDDNMFRQMEEIILLRHEMWTRHPGMLEMYGYCREEGHLGAVYTLVSKPLDSIRNLIPKDDFSWPRRIKAALGLANLLKILHAECTKFYKPFVVNNLDAAHVVVDEDCNIKLCDFSWITGGIFPKERSRTGYGITGCYGYTDIGSSSEGHFSSKQDVFAFGVILLSLISKRVYSEGTPFVYEWAREKSEGFESDMKDIELSLVHETLTAEVEFYRVDDGYKITKLALECVDRVESQRPKMEQVYGFLRKLEVVKQHSELFELGKHGTAPL